LNKKIRHIIVTGTPGTGKTTLAKALAKRFSLKYVDVSAMVKDGLSEGYDKEKDCEIVDTGKLADVLGRLDEKSVIDSHLSHYMKKEDVGVCFVCKCDIRELKKRLEERGYSETKARENLDSEIFDICATEARESGHKVIEVWTDRDIDYGALEKFI